MNLLMIGRNLKIKQKQNLMSNTDFLHEEIEWPEGMQELYDKGLVKIEYDSKNNLYFSLTSLGRSVFNEINLKFH